MKLIYLKTFIFITVGITTLQLRDYIVKHPDVQWTHAVLTFVMLLLTGAAWICLRFVKHRLLTIALSIAATLGSLYILNSLRSGVSDVVQVAGVAAVIVVLWALSVFGHNLIKNWRKPADSWHKISGVDSLQAMMDD